MGIRSSSGMYEDVSGGVTAGGFRAVPWHGVGDCVASNGQVVGHKYLIEGDPRTLGEIMDVASAHWEPQPRLLSELGVTYAGAENIKLLVREDRQAILGVHSDKYGIIKNRTGFQFVAELLHYAPQAHLVSTVELFGGEVMFSVIEFDHGIEAVRHNGRTTDRITRYMGVYWSHNGRYNLVVKFMNELWVCRNTFTPRTGITGLTIRHTRNAQDIADAAIHTMERMVVASEQFDQEVAELLAIEADRETMTKVVIPTVLEKERPTDEGRSQTIWDNQFDAIIAEWNEFTDQQTAFDCVMAVQGWEQHRQTIRGASRDVRGIQRIMGDVYPKTELAYSCFDLAATSN